MKKNLLSLSICFIVTLFSCEQPQAVKGVVSHCENGRYQMHTLQKSDNQDLIIIVIDTKTGDVAMREAFSGVWTKQGNPKDAK